MSLYNVRDAGPLTFERLLSPSNVASTHTSVLILAIFSLWSAASDAFITAFEKNLLPNLQRHTRSIAYLSTRDSAGRHAFVYAAMCNSRPIANRLLRTAEHLPEAMYCEALDVEVLRLRPARFWCFD